MLKRLIEVALPLKEVSEQSAREKSIRHGHISTLHIWWARRPLAACRAAVFASLIPDPDDPDCPEQFRKLVMEVLSRGEFKPKNGEGSTVEDTPRNRCLEFIKHLVRWENSNNPEYIEPARKLIAAAHKFLHPDAEGDAPKVLDPFAGGGAIPLEALRLGCEAHAVDLNPVAHLIELCTLVYPQKYGQPDSRPVPDYIKRLIAHNKAKKKARSGKELFDDGEHGSSPPTEGIIPDVEITEAEYRKNPLAADVKYWGHWIFANAKQELSHLYPQESDNQKAVAYIWARTLPCSNPECGATIPLVRQLTLVKKKGRRLDLVLTVDKKNRHVGTDFVRNATDDLVEESATVQRGSVKCPICENTQDDEWTRQSFRSGRAGNRLLAVVTSSTTGIGKDYRLPADADLDAAHMSKELVSALSSATTQTGLSRLPQEPLATDEPRRMNVVLFGIEQWQQLFNERQLVAIDCFRRNTVDAIAQGGVKEDDDYFSALQGMLACVLGGLQSETQSGLSGWGA